MPRYDLEIRTLQFAKECRDFSEAIPKTVSNYEYTKQLIRSSGSQAANYQEANEALGRKDFLMRIRICIKEVKESALWLNLCQTNHIDSLKEKKQTLINESQELRKIFGAILAKTRK